MSEKELIDLIHDTVGDALNRNIDRLHPLINSLITTSNHLTEEELKNQTESVLRYSIFVSEVSCIAMSKTLAALGIINISLTDD